MKQLFTFAAILFCTAQLAVGQVVMKIHKHGGTVVQIPLSQIDSITYDVAGLATVVTYPAHSITNYTFTTIGRVTADGGAPISERGICYSTSTGPTISNTKIAVGSDTGFFSAPISGLVPGTTYYIRAYGTNVAGTEYGNEISVTTLSLPPTTFISDFEGQGFWTLSKIGTSPVGVVSDSADNTTQPIPGAHSGSHYWRAAGTSDHYYLEGIDANGAFNLDGNDSIIFYAHNVNNPEHQSLCAAFRQKNTDER